jgi:uncharacterized protein YkwD
MPMDPREGKGPSNRGTGDVKTHLAKRTLLKRKTAAIAMAVLIALGLSACGLPNSSSGPPPDPKTQRLYGALTWDRGTVGLGALTWSPKLAYNAANWACTMRDANTLYHQNLAGLLANPDYAVFWTLGENIMVGPGSMTGDQIEGVWRNSPPHWANITSRAFTHVGIGYCYGGDGRIWAVQEFAGA